MSVLRGNIGAVTTIAFSPRHDCSLRRVLPELDGYVMLCVRDQNGNHAIQKCIECIPQDDIEFIVLSFYNQVVNLFTHPYGCRVIQRVLEHCDDPNTQQIMMAEILQSVCKLAKDQYGNYVVQHVLEHGKPHERTVIITQLDGQIVEMSQHKFASNVVEKCLAFGDPTEHQILVNEMLGSTDENEPLQHVLEHGKPRERTAIITQLDGQIVEMSQQKFASNVVEKFLAFGDPTERQILVNEMLGSTDENEHLQVGDENSKAKTAPMKTKVKSCSKFCRIISNH